MFISVIVPAYNSEKTIEKCVNSLLRSDYHNYEIIVVDDGSIDKTFQLVKKYPIKHIRQINQGPAAARNTGFRMAEGDIIYYTDSDCIVPPDTLKKIEEHFLNEKIVGVGSTYRTLNKENVVARFAGYEISFRHSKKNIEVFGTYSAAFRKKILEELNGFDTSFKKASGEDFDLCYRIKKRGYKLVFDPEIYVWHEHPSSLIAYMRQQFERGKTRTKNVIMHKNMAISDSYVERGVQIQPLLILIFIFFGLLGFFNSSFWMVSLVSLVLLYSINISFVKYVLKKEPQIILLTAFMLFFRPLIWTVGILTTLKELFITRITKKI